jgi:hypothetical protein
MVFGALTLGVFALGAAVVDAFVFLTTGDALVAAFASAGGFSTVFFASEALTVAAFTVVARLVAGVFAAGFLAAGFAAGFFAVFVAGWVVFLVNL